MADQVRRDYLPTGFVERMKWLNNFALQLKTYGPGLSIAAAEITRVNDMAQTYAFALTQFVPYDQSFSKGVTVFVNELDSDAAPQAVLFPTYAPPVAPTPAAPLTSGFFNFVVKMVDERILKSPNLTPAIKTALGLDPQVPPPSSGPSFTKAEAHDGGPIDLSARRGGAHLLEVRGRLAGATNWDLSDKFAASHYLDNRPNKVPGVSEVREYEVRDISDPRNPGNWSAVFQATTRA